jgi:hypothetical protein
MYSSSKRTTLTHTCKPRSLSACPRKFSINVNVCKVGGPLVVAAKRRFEALLRQIEGKLQGGGSKARSSESTSFVAIANASQLRRASTSSYKPRLHPPSNDSNVEMSILVQHLDAFATRRANFRALRASRDFTPSGLAQRRATNHAGRWDVPRWKAGEEEEA